MTEPPTDAVPLVPDQTAETLNERQRLAYREHRRQLISWMVDLGKNPEKATGYAETVVRTRGYRLDSFYRWVWDQEGFTTEITAEHADGWMRWLARQDYKESYKTCCQKAVKTLFKWKQYEKGRDDEWDPVITYSDPSTQYQPRDYLERDERKALRQAAMEYKTIPHYSALTPEERDEWKAHLAQRFDKPKTEISKKEWQRANSFKFPAMIYTALDAGLRPVEIGRARVQWVDLENGMLRIPAEQSSKNRDNWRVPLRDDTVAFLRKWLDERTNHTKYTGSDRIWLTRECNPYSSASLNHHFAKLCEEAEIKTDDRDLSWYAIRHSTGKHLADEKGLPAAGAQLRHKSTRTTQKYAHPSTEVQRDGVDRIG